MASAVNSSLHDIKLKANDPQILALKYTEGRPVGEWGNVMFSTADNRRLFLNGADADALAKELAAIAYRPGERIRVTRAPRGASPSLRVQRAGAADFKEATDQVVEQSAAMARSGLRVAPKRAEASSHGASAGGSATASDSMPARAAAGRLLAGSLIASIDAWSTAKDYAATKNFKLEVRVEDVRTSANAMFLELWRAGERG